MEIIFRIFLFIIGACVGSFLCCQARRLRLRQAKTHRRAPAKAKSSVKSGTRSSAHRTPKLPPRSICLHCKKSLKWYDNLPLISWLALRGKCRFCHRRIGLAEFLAELTTAVAFPLLSLTLNVSTASYLDWLIFICALLFTATLIFLAIYDGLYGELPNLCLIISIIFGAVICALKIWNTILVAPFTITILTDPILATAILGGLYLVLYLVSRGRWVGDGDWLLATAIALVIGQPVLAFVELFLSNLLASLIMLPVMKGNTHAKIHFGPFLVAAFVIVYSFSPFVMTIML